MAPVWVNDLGGVTFQIAGGAEFVKTAKPQWWAHLAREAARLRWAGRYVEVPRVLGTGEGWLHTAGLPGRSAVDPMWLGQPVTAARAIGAGLRALHDRLPVDDCPFDWSAGSRLAEVPAPQRAGLVEVPPIAGRLSRRRVRAEHADR